MMNLDLNMLDRLCIDAHEALRGSTALRKIGGALDWDRPIIEAAFSAVMLWELKHFMQFETGDQRLDYH